MASTNEALRDESVRHLIGLQRYGGSLARRIIGLLNRSDLDLVRQIAERLDAIDRRGFDLGPATTARLQRLLEAIREQSRDLYNVVYAELRTELGNLARSEVESEAERIDRAVGIDLNILRPAPETLRSAVTSQPFRGKLLREWAGNLEADKVRRLGDAVRIGIVEGEPTADIVRRIRGTREAGYRDGILEITRRNAEAVTRTAVNHIATRSRDMLYDANQDLMRGVVWVSVLDNRTTPICRSRDGEVYPVGKGPRPPAHVGCRSTTAPVLKSWADLAKDKSLQRGRGAQDIDTLFRKKLKERGFSDEQIANIQRNTRASMDGQVPADVTYQEWLRRQSAATQDDILGASKGALFRRGGLSLDRFVDRAGQELTLDQLKSRNAAAFERAGV
jgi:SPP1 gp7 family putative phage head morphogenesis protein